jgi:hypothetical protein
VTCFADVKYSVFHMGLGKINVPLTVLLSVDLIVIIANVMEILVALIVLVIVIIAPVIVMVMEEPVVRVGTILHILALVGISLFMVNVKILIYGCSKSW